MTHPEIARAMLRAEAQDRSRRARHRKVGRRAKARRSVRSRRRVLHRSRHA